jgi:hypothetical protein
VTVPMICVLSHGADPAGLTSSSVRIDPLGIRLNSVKIPLAGTPGCAGLAWPPWGGALLLLGGASVTPARVLEGRGH